MKQIFFYADNRWWKLIFLCGNCCLSSQIRSPRKLIVEQRKNCSLSIHKPFASKLNPWVTLHAHSPWYCLLTRDRSSPGGPRSEVSIVWETLAPRSIWIQITSSKQRPALTPGGYMTIWLIWWHYDMTWWQDDPSHSLTRSRRRPPLWTMTRTESVAQEAESSLWPESRGEEETRSALLQIKTTMDDC